MRPSFVLWSKKGGGCKEATCQGYRLRRKLWWIWPWWRGEKLTYSITKWTFCISAYMVKLLLKVLFMGILYRRSLPRSWSVRKTTLDLENWSMTWKKTRTHYSELLCFRPLFTCWDLNIFKYSASFIKWDENSGHKPINTERSTVVNLASNTRCNKILKGLVSWPNWAPAGSQV